jgi:hypothetical protein
MLIAVGIVEEKRQIHVNLHSSLSQTQLNLAVLCPFLQIHLSLLSKKSEQWESL